MSKAKSIVSQKDTELLSTQQKEELSKKLPEWVLELEEKGTAVLRWNQEFLILIEELLKRHWGFSENDLKRLEISISETLPHLHKMALENLVILRPADMERALDIVDAYKKQISAERLGIILPTSTTTKFFGKVKKQK